MLYLVVTNICANISLLMVLALLLTRIPFFRALILGSELQEDSEEARRQDLFGKITLGLIFSAFCIISDRIGIQVTGALPNARVIGILASGLLGGPIPALMTAVIAAIHRYIIFPQRISTTACVISALIQGVMAAVIGYRCRNRREYKGTFLAGITFIAELVHIVLILILTRPYQAAAEIVREVIVPMALMNSVGMILFFNIFRSIFSEADLKAASMISLAIRTVERCTPYLGGVALDSDSGQKIIEAILAEYHCPGAALIRDCDFLGRSDAFRDIRLEPNSYPRLLSAAAIYRTTRISRIPKPEDAFYPLYRENVILAAPVIPDEETLLVLVLLVRKSAYSYQADVEFASGLASFFALQMNLAELERKKEELRKAELLALQSQINPHFLFNALNTISCFCREKPEKARELLMALSAYFRNTLSEIDYMIPLEKELEHVRAYVLLEEARFEDRLTVEIQADDRDCACRVPNLILQPIVENAIRHGAMHAKHMPGEVRIRVKREKKNTLIDVWDNGPGISRRIVEQLYEKTNIPKPENGHGIGLRNVHRRLIDVFGRESGLQIMSGEGDTLVRIIIPNDFREESV